MKRSTSQFQIIILLVIFLSCNNNNNSAPFIVLASPGDYSPAYKRCVSFCTSICPSSPPLPFSLRLLGWTCLDDCRYQCTHRLTKLNLSKPKRQGTFEHWWDEADWTVGSDTEGLPAGHIVQFHGKWPFKRWLGMQEPASVLFSVLNFASYASSLKSMRKATGFGQARLKREYMGVVYAGLNAWIWSAIFHCRDRDWTERADYIFAAWYTIWGLYVSLVRTFRLYRGTKRRRWMRNGVLVGILVVFGLHVWWLHRGERFDYDYNMAFNVTASLLIMILWLRWTLIHHFSEASIPSTNPSTSTTTTGATTTTAVKLIRPPHYLGTILPSIWLLSAGALELLDFPPVMGIDAHALWHLATIPLARIWCEGFLVKDAYWIDNEETRLDRYE